VVTDEDAAADLFSGPMGGAAPADQRRIATGRRAGRGARGSAMYDAIEEEVPTVDVKITGWWRWKQVIVPPNAFVVHTRRGHTEPLHCGMGLSFDYNPSTDTFLVVPGTIQTILISANCICKERQGILVQGYVQWAIEDFAAAYKKLDFSDPLDPMRVVTTQLQEQAEATIKDAVATMSIDDVLADKQPIITELTRRLRETTESGGAGEGGLGLRIVTVQIKEAVVASATLWETLQRPFRAERAKEARMAELDQQRLITERESAIRAEEEQRRIDADAQVARHRRDAEVAEREHAAAAAQRQAELDAKTERDRLELEQQTQEQQVAAAQLRFEQEERLASIEDGRAEAAHNRRLKQIEHEIEEQERRNTAHFKQRTAGLKFEEQQQKLRNSVSDGALRARLIEQLPQIISDWPTPESVRHYHAGPSPLTGLLEELLDHLRGAGGEDAAT
jgi:regulator of protease activity HflC (stomatin/prohibitin superfamily)